MPSHRATAPSGGPRGVRAARRGATLGAVALALVAAPALSGAAGPAGGEIPAGQTQAAAGLLGDREHTAASRSIERDVLEGLGTAPVVSADDSTAFAETELASELRPEATAPEPEPEPEPATGGEKPDGGTVDGGQDGAADDGGVSPGTSGGSCTVSTDIAAHLQPNAHSVYEAVCARFPQVSAYGGYRPGDSGDHGSGRAVDIMISGETGWQIARYLQQNAGSLGITYVIYQQQMWLAGSSFDAWRGMEDRGSPTANHFDHVHASTS